jgi:hypothetical protein
MVCVSTCFFTQLTSIVTVLVGIFRSSTRAVVTFSFLVWKKMRKILILVNQ